MFRLVADGVNGLRREAFEVRVVDERRGQHESALRAAHPEEPPPDEWLLAWDVQLSLLYGGENARRFLSGHPKMCSAAERRISSARDPEHPIRWAWTSHADRHREGLALMARPGLAQAQILRFTRSGMARRWLRQIACA